MKFMQIWCLATGLLIASNTRSAYTIICWETGCQLNSWAVRGCQQYGMIETGQKTCTDGIIYSCCEPNGTSSASIAKPKCWDTGCQLDAWAVRGCEQYGMVETGQKWCQDGIVYSCCEPNINNNSIGSNSSTSGSTSGGNIVPVRKVKPICWDTGCQLNSWAVRGCEQYGMAEVGQKLCENGVVYSCCEKNVVTHTTASSVVGASKPKCWDTGCQLDAWAIRGCGQYDMLETGQKPCHRGVIYSCCEKNATSAASGSSAVSEGSAAVSRISATSADLAASGSTDSSSTADASSASTASLGSDTPSLTIVTPTTTLSDKVPTASQPKCWDTGCQLNSWAVRGCEQYDMVETGRRLCHDGIIYSCCQKNSSTAASAAKPKCWATGCQLDSWAVRGCEQYGMVETGRTPCLNGIVYSCCEQNGTSTGSVAQVSKPKCWDTGCQLDAWAVRGCEQYNMIEVGQKSCPDGIVYSCCDKNMTTSMKMGDATAAEGATAIAATPPTPKLQPKCWDTGCQLDWWAVRGCEQYDMVEVGQKACDQGIVYSCCHKNGTVPVSRPAPKRCWDTGCQLDVWKSRGCEQYGMIEKAQRSCLNGIVFTCCRP